MNSSLSFFTHLWKKIKHITLKYEQKYLRTYKIPRFAWKGTDSTFYCRFTSKGKKTLKDDILQTLCKLKITD